MVSFTDDILIEIFAFLPLNSIYKLRCLSKVWLSNLSSPNFITKWFQINEKSLPLIQYHTMSHHDDSDENPLKFINAYPESYSEFMSRNVHLFSFKFLRNTKPFQGTEFYPLGSSNGLVLCWSCSSEDGRRRYHVCNPLTQKWVSLPSPPCSELRLFDVHGIFCDNSASFASRYKVVHIPEFDTPQKKFNVDVFSSDLGEWQTFEVSCDENVVWDISNFDKVVILNGVLYWIEGGNRVLLYNLNRNKGNDRHCCSLINLPDDEFDNTKYRDLDCRIGESEGWVCCARTRWITRKLTVSVWVLNEVSWQILHKDVSIKDILAEACSQIGNQIAMVRVLGISRVDRNVVLLGLNNLVWRCNFQTRSSEELRLENRHVDDGSVTLLPFELKLMPTSISPSSWIET